MTNRRNFLGGSIAVTAATLSSSALSQANPVLPIPPLPSPIKPVTGTISTPIINGSPTTLKMQTAFSATEMLSQFGEEWSKRLNEIGGDILKIEFLPVGTITSAFNVVKAASEGKMDGGLTYAAYQHSLNPAFSLWCAGPGYGMDSKFLLAWHNNGGGKVLLDKLYKSLNIDIVSLAFMPLPNQPFGWFNKEITKLEDLKGLKFRTAGLALEIYKEIGVDAIAMAGGEIIEAIQNKKLDGAEWNNMTSDKTMGLNKVCKYCMLQSYSEAVGVMELVFNSKVWNSLSERQKNLIKTVSNAISAEGPWKISEKNTNDYEEMAQTGTKFLRTPTTILQAQINAWDRVIAKHSASNPIFSEIVVSQKLYAKRTIKWNTDISTDSRKVYNHYFNRRTI